MRTREWDGSGWWRVIMELEIRRFGGDDLGGVVALFERARPLGVEPPNTSTGDAFRYCAWSEGRLVAYGANSGENRSTLVLVVDPVHRRQGVATRLWERLRADMVGCGIDAARVWVRQENAGYVAWLVARGFEQVDRDGPVCLSPACTVVDRFRVVNEGLAARGITITTLEDELRGNPDCLAQLYALYCAVERDVPRDGRYSPPDYAAFAAQCQGTDAMRDGYFIAVHDGRYVGLSNVAPRGADIYFEERHDILQQCLTGVLPEYRRCGIATALKCRTIEYAARLGYRQMWTNSDNPAMRALNWKMGYRTGPWLVYLKQVSSGVVAV